jgi:hypothetical protein
MGWVITLFSRPKVNRRFEETRPFLEVKAKQETNMKQAVSVSSTCYTLVSCPAYSSTLKMEMICSSEISVDTQRTTLRYIPEDNTLHNHRCENLKPSMSTPSPMLFAKHTNLKK